VTEHVVIYSGTNDAPGPWAAAREAEGWSGVSVPDHLWVNGRPIRHVWVTLAEMAAATSTIRLTSGFANNLARSPVELAQAALSLHAASGGRFDAGIGAGWDEAETTALGERFPPPGERSERLAEAVQILGALLRDGGCRFDGRWYTVDIPSIGPAVPAEVAPPRVIAAATGRRTVERVVPYVDVLELKPSPFSVPGKGTMDVRRAAALGLDDLRAAVDHARSRRPEVALSTFLPVGCGDDPVVGALRERLAGSVLGPLFGSPAEVADAVERIAAAGFERVQLGPVSAATPTALAPALLSARASSGTAG
jgi:alkanesulfonate monooxygenase SsuD/methylene tetrahydromethanopterin reductase-like flavin-dependent oxidoreductase (luciferase family)